MLFQKFEVVEQFRFGLPIECSTPDGSAYRRLSAIAEVLTVEVVASIHAQTRSVCLTNGRCILRQHTIVTMLKKCFPHTAACRTTMRRVIKASIASATV